MSTFFHGWRRKAGCIALVMAAVLFGMWIRSQVVFDTTAFMVWDRQHEVFSAAGRIHWWAFTPWGPTFSIQTNRLTRQESLQRIEMGRSYLQTMDLNFEEMDISHWWLISPLTLVSAYLILCKPRKKP